MGATPSSPTFPKPGIQIIPTTTVNFSNDWTSNDQKVVFEAQKFGDEEIVFYDPKSNKFYSKLSLSPSSVNETFPRISNIEFLIKEKGYFAVGHEINNGGTSFVLNTVTSVWFGANNCTGQNGQTGEKNRSSCNPRSTIVIKNPGTYTCSTGGLGVNDPFPGVEKWCQVAIPIRIIRILNYSLNTSLTFSEEKNVY